MAVVKIIISKKILETLYLKKNLTPLAIGQKLGCSFKTVRNRLKEHGIQFKNPSYARMKYPKKDFDESLSVKAYMIGFRLGDLNVYRVSTNSQTIVVRCHTTQACQISLIKSLFQKFGRVTISSNKGHFHINCMLNNSFLFLLSKGDAVWEWIKNEDELTSLNFIAGYVDAEGNFIINQGRARFKIDSYDSSILKWISEWLKRNNIENKLRIIYKKGEKVPNQSPFPKDLWRLNINQANSLELFIHKIKPILKHTTRISQADNSLSNLYKRKTYA